MGQVDTAIWAVGLDLGSSLPVLELDRTFDAGHAPGSHMVVVLVGNAIEGLENYA